jgi:hypothetical protein
LGSAISTYDITDCYNGYISVKGVSLTLRDVDIVDNESFFQYSTTGITSGSGGAIRLLSGRLLMEATSIHDNTGSGIWAEHSDITCLGEVANRGGSWGNSWYGFYGFTAMSSTVLNKNFFASYGCDFGTGADDNARADIHVWRLVNYGAILPVNPSFGDGLNTQFSFSVDPFVMSYPTKIYVDVTHVSSGVSEIEKFSDNLTGFLTGGLGGSGTIDYATGQIAVDLALVPDVMTPVQLKYLRIDNNYDYKDDESFYCDQGSGDCY